MTRHAKYQEDPCALPPIHRGNGAKQPSLLSVAELLDRYGDPGEIPDMAELREAMGDEIASRIPGEVSEESR